MPRRKKKIVAKLVGGLGNQIFIYFAALDLARQHNRELILDFSFIERSHSDGNSRLDAFIIEGFKVEYTGVRKSLKVFKEWICDVLSVRGFDLFAKNFLDEKNLDTLASRPNSRTFTLRGFHSSAKHYESLGSPDLKLIKESDKFRQLKLQVSNCVAIHLRGGDFGLYSSTFGPLSAEYYLKALSTNAAVKDLASRELINIFSDDRERSLKLRNFLEEKGFRIMEVSFEFILTPAEELLLLSSAKSIIMANSTFSFWASEMSRQGTLIICPENFTRSGEPVDFDSRKSRIFNKPEWE